MELECLIPSSGNNNVAGSPSMAFCFVWQVRGLASLLETWICRVPFVEVMIKAQAQVPDTSWWGRSGWGAELWTRGSTSRRKGYPRTRGRRYETYSWWWRATFWWRTTTSGTRRMWRGSMRRSSWTTSRWRWSSSRACRGSAEAWLVGYVGPRCASWWRSFGSGHQGVRSAESTLARRSITAAGCHSLQPPDGNTVEESSCQWRHWGHFLDVWPIEISAVATPSRSHGQGERIHEQTVLSVASPQRCSSHNHRWGRASGLCSGWRRNQCS